MSQANIESIEALKEFRIALCSFTEAVRNALAEADGDIQRTALWLTQEQRAWWKAQLRVRAEAVTRAKIALLAKQQQTEGRQSCVDEQKALARAKARLEEAQKRSAAVDRWSVKLSEETFTWRGAAQGMIQAVDGDIPTALAWLERMMTALDSYTALAAPEAQVTPDTAATTGMARGGERVQPEQPREGPATEQPEQRPPQAPVL